MKFQVQQTFKVPIDKLFKAWLNSEEHSSMTGGEAVADDIEGNSFSAWDGYIFGKNIEIVPSKYIKQSWRTTEFRENEQDSIVMVEFLDEDGLGTIIITHSNLPEHGMQYMQGWKDHYFTPMLKYFDSQ